MKTAGWVLTLLILATVLFLWPKEAFFLGAEELSPSAMVARGLSALAVPLVFLVPRTASLLRSAIRVVPFALFGFSLQAQGGGSIALHSPSPLFIVFSDLALLAAMVTLAGRLAAVFTELAEAMVLVSRPLPEEHVRPMEEAAREVQREVSRCRRKNEPLSVILVRPDHLAVSAQSNRLIEEMQQALADRHLKVRLGQLISQSLRTTDVVVEERAKGYFVILCPDTGQERIALITERIQNSVFKEMAVPMTFGSATMPIESFSFDGLIDKAASRLPVQEKGDGHAMVERGKADLFADPGPQTN